MKGGWRSDSIETPTMLRFVLGQVLLDTSGGQVISFSGKNTSDRRTHTTLSFVVGAVQQLHMCNTWNVTEWRVIPKAWTQTGRCL